MSICSISTPFVNKNFFILVTASEDSKQGPIIIFCKQFKGIPTSIYGIGSPFLPMRNLDIIFFFIIRCSFSAAYFICLYLGASLLFIRDRIISLNSLSSSYKILKVLSYTSFSILMLFGSV